MENQVPPDVIKNRFDRLLSLVQTISARLTQANVGKTFDVLVEDINEHDETFVTGRMSNNSIIHFKGDPSLIGTIVKVNITEAKGFYYIGVMEE